MSETTTATAAESLEVTEVEVTEVASEENAPVNAEAVTTEASVIGDAPPVKKSSKTVGGSVTECRRKLYDVPCAKITSNAYNPDQKRFPVLSQMGYYYFQADAPEGTDPDMILMNLAKSDDPVKRNKFLKLFEEYEPDVMGLGQSIHARGLLQPVQIRKVEHDLHLVFGCRRLFSVMCFQIATAGKLGKIRADIVEVSERDARVNAVVENLQRKNVTVLNEAEAIKIRINVGGESLQDIAKDLGLSVQTVQSRYDLSGAPEALKNEVKSGKVGVTEASAIATAIKKGKDVSTVAKGRRQAAKENDTPARRTLISYKECEKLYDELVPAADCDPSHIEFYKEQRKLLARVMKMRFGDAEVESRRRIRDKAKSEG